jgi:hypothetical protein
MGLPWYPMAGAGSRYYLGSPGSTPCVLDVRSAGDVVREARPDLAPALVGGTFRSIALDPADLLPVRGVPVREVAPQGRREAPRPPRRDTTGWQPPTSRRSEVRAI